MIQYKELNVDFLIQRFPEFEEEIRAEVDGLDEFLVHCVFGNIFNAKVVELLKRADYSENDMLHRIFEMYEDFAVAGDEETRNLLQVTLLEYLWDEKVTYGRALELMGAGTKEIWDNIREYIFIPTE